MKKIKCMLDNTEYKSKPSAKYIGLIQNSLKETELTIEELANYLVKGCTFRPAVLANGRGDKHWMQQQLIGLDFDEGTTIQEELNRCKELNILPVFGYTSFSHTEELHKFRLVFCFDEVVIDKSIMSNIFNKFKELFINADTNTFTLSRLFFGGKNLIYKEYDNIVKISTLKIEETVGGLIDYNKKYIYNTTYHSRKTPTVKTSADNVNYNIQAIKQKDIKYLQKILNIKNEVELQNEQDFYNYIKSKINLPELLGIDKNNFYKFNCIIHNDTNPSAGIIIGDSGDYIYNCFGCGFCGNIIHVIQALTKMKTYQVIEYIKEIYNIKILKTDWQKEQIKILEVNKQMLINGDFEIYYPGVHKLIRRYVPQLIMMHDIAIMNVRDENYTDKDGNIVFFISNVELTKMMDSRSNKRVNQRNVLFAFLHLLKKLDKNEIPKEDLEKALKIQHKYDHHKIVNFFSLGDYDIFKMKNSEKRASMWKENNMSMTGLSYEGFYRTFGQKIAWEVYPQYKNKTIKTKNGCKEIPRTTTKASNERTAKIASVMINEINDKKYVVEKEVIEKLKFKYGKTLTLIQIKRSLQEILDLYNFKRIRCNKEVKEKYNVDSKGYPFIIVKNDN